VNWTCGFCEAAVVPLTKVTVAGLKLQFHEVAVPVLKSVNNTVVANGGLRLSAEKSAVARIGFTVIVMALETGLPLMQVTPGVMATEIISPFTGT
jgi:hypothetical protein